MAAPPLTVVTSAYKRPRSLAEAMKTALAQSFSDFEYLVIGDHCEDETEDVVRGFNDPRIVWRNLPENTGNQSGVNKIALEMARGQIIAYLNQDDLWFPDHLETLIGPLNEHQLDIVSSLCIAISPPGHRYNAMLGLPYRASAQTLDYAPMTSTVMHTAEAAKAAGGWIDWRQSKAVPTLDFYNRLRTLRGRFAVVPHVTTLKFHSGDRIGSYAADDPSELVRYAALMQSDPQLRYRELMIALASRAIAEPPPQVKTAAPPAEAPPGFYIEQLRRIRGLEPMLDIGHQSFEAPAPPPERLLRVPDKGWPLIASTLANSSTRTP